jgi:hypothetical protein
MVIKSGKIRRAVHVERTGKMENAYKILIRHTHTHTVPLSYTSRLPHVRLEALTVTKWWTRNRSETFRRSCLCQGIMWSVTTVGWCMSIYRSIEVTLSRWSRAVVTHHITPWWRKTISEMFRLCFALTRLITRRRFHHLHPFLFSNLTVKSKNNYSSAV